MDDLPSRPPQGTPEVQRRIVQPEDESPDVYVKDGRLVSRNPTEPKKRAQFQTDQITSNFDYRPLLQAANEFVKVNDFDGFVKCWENSIMDIKTEGHSVFITLRPGD